MTPAHFAFSDDETTVKDNIARKQEKDGSQSPERSLSADR